MAKIAAVSMHSIPDKTANLKKFIELIDEAAKQDVDLVAFPELALQCYPPSMGMYDPIENEYQHKNAELVPEGESTQSLIKKAKEHNMYICWGMTELSHERPEIMYNSAVLVGPEGFVGCYRKVHNPGTERLYYQPGNDFPVFDTKIGRIGLMICYDKAFPEAARCLALNGAHIIICPTAWPCHEYSEDDVDVRFTNVYEKTRAMENQVFYVSSNLIGEYPYCLCCGLSRIINPVGEIIATTNMTDEAMAIADVDVTAAIQKARAGAQGMCSNFFRDRRPDHYEKITEITKYNFMQPKE